MKLRLITFIAATMTALYAFAQHGEGKSNIAQLTSKDTLQSYKTCVSFGRMNSTATNSIPFRGTAANEPKNNGAATCHRPIQFAALAMEL